MATVDYMAKCAQPMTPHWIRLMAARIGRVRGISFKNGLPTRGWSQRFMNRHPDLIQSVPSLIDGGRKAMSRASVFDRFFADMKPTLE